MCHHLLFDSLVSSCHCMPMSLAILTASEEAPESPLLVNPTAYTPQLPFHPLGKGLFGIPSLLKKSHPCAEIWTNYFNGSPSNSVSTAYRKGSIQNKYLKPLRNVAAVSCGQDHGIYVENLAVDELHFSRREVLDSGDHLDLAGLYFG